MKSPLNLLSLLLVSVVALEHVYFFYLEAVAWTKPLGRRTFGTTAEFAEASKGLAANQGLYNLFLSAGLVWGLLHPVSTVSSQIQAFFLSCVLVAAIFGALTVKRSILWIQGLPAALAFACLLLR